MPNKLSIYSYDGTKLAADYYETNSQLGAILAHGITSEKTEAGFYSRLAKRLNEIGFSCLSIDLRSHGESEGKQEDFYLSGAINDICSGIDFLTKQAKKKVAVFAASFSGGLAIRVAEIKRDVITHMVLFNPRLDYSPWIKDTQFWDCDQLSEQAHEDFKKTGYITRKGFKLGKPMANELLCFNPAAGLTELNIPILFIHGEKDSVIPIKSSIQHYNLNGKGQILRIENAAHGFTDYKTNDPYSDVSIQIRENVIEKTIGWIKNGKDSN